jgi:hypothetical protein
MDCAEVEFAPQTLGRVVLYPTLLREAGTLTLVVTLSGLAVPDVVQQANVYGLEFCLLDRCGRPLRQHCAPPATFGPVLSWPTVQASARAAFAAEDQDPTTLRIAVGEDLAEVELQKVPPPAPVPVTRGNPRRKCCPDEDTAKKLPHKRSGVKKGRRLIPDLHYPPDSPRKIYEYFQMNVDFRNSDDGCACKCCEYRQMVRGRVTQDGKDVDVKVIGGLLHPTVWREDARLDHRGHGTLEGYGRRRLVSDITDDYLPDRADGCEYRGQDAPNIPIDGNWKMNVEFEGRVVDVCNNERIVASHRWRVRLP